MKIRYHHLMCIPRFEGKGYSEEFCKNLKIIKDNWDDGKIELVNECDDVCKFCPNMKNGKCKDELIVKYYDKKVEQKIKKGEQYQPKDICSSCQWYYICKSKGV